MSTGIRLAADAADEGLAAAGDHDVDQIVQLQKLTHRLTVGRVDQLHAVDGEAAFRDRLPHALDDAGTGMGCLLATAENDRVAGGEGDRGGIGRDVGPRLVNEKDDAERHADLADEQARGLSRFLEHFADRIGERGHRLDPGGNRLDPLGIEREAVDRGGREAEAGGGSEVESIGGQDGVGIAADAGGGCPQAGGLAAGVNSGQIDRGPSGPGGDVAAMVSKGVHGPIVADCWRAARTRATS